MSETGNNSCEDAIYSEDYVPILIDYSYDITSVVQRYNPICYQTLSLQQAILYVSLPQQITLLNSQFTYRQIPKCYGLLKTESLEETGVLKLRRQPYLDLYGQGVIVGFIDTGIEYTHPAFINADNTTRIISIWDQNIRTGNSPEGMLYGTEYGQEQINEAIANENPLEIVPSTDTNGHGTFMAGVTAGNIDESEDFSGYAPSAEICVVKLKPAKNRIREYFLVNQEVGCYSEDDIMSGIAYLTNIANRLQRPIVICLGIGTNSGDHNGNSSLGRLMNYKGGFAGVVFVTAAGNEANRGHHYLSSTIQPQATEDVEIRVGPNESGLAIELWADTLGLFSVGFVSPSGETINLIQPRIGKVETVNFLLEKTVATVEYYLIEPESGDELIMLRFQNPTTGIWKIRVYNDGGYESRYNMWLPMENFISRDTVFSKPEPDTTICEPGNTRIAVTTTNYNSRTNSIYVYSSRGYTRSNRVKPTLASPGVDIFGTLLRGRYGTKTGSSVASAVAAGICVLLIEWGIVLQNDLDMDSLEIQRYLIIGATRRDLAYPNTEWGFGEINLYNIFERLRSS